MQPGKFVPNAHAVPGYQIHFSNLSHNATWEIYMCVCVCRCPSAFRDQVGFCLHGAQFAANHRQAQGHKAEALSFARGHCTIGKEIVGIVLDRIVKLGLR